MASAPTVADLREKAKQGKPIEEFSEGIVRDIDLALTRHETKFGRNCVSVDVPVSTTIHGLARDDAQRIMYSHLISVYEKRGFDVRVQLAPRVTILHLLFDVEFDSSFQKSLTQKITSRRVGDGVPDGLKLLHNLKNGAEPLKVPGARASGGAGGHALSRSAGSAGHITVGVGTRRAPPR